MHGNHTVSAVRELLVRAILLLQPSAQLCCSRTAYVAQFTEVNIALLRLIWYHSGHVPIPCVANIPLCARMGPFQDV